MSIQVECLRWRFDVRERTKRGANGWNLLVSLTGFNGRDKSRRISFDKRSAVEGLIDVQSLRRKQPLDMSHVHRYGRQKKRCTKAYYSTYLCVYLEIPNTNIENTHAHTLYLTHTHTHTHTLSLSLSLSLSHTHTHTDTIYIYIYIHVCVWVCVCFRFRFLCSIH